MPSRSLDKEIHNLYGLPPGEFVSARDALAKRLAADGLRPEATTVKSLRRPTVAAWVVNQLVRRHPAEVDELLRAGDQLRRAQRKALSGVSGGGLREASEPRRKAIRVLVQRAQAFLDEAGHASGGTIEAVQATLEAASTDEPAGRALREGRLEKELPPPAGFGAVEGLALVPSPHEEPSEQEPPAGPRAPGKGRRAASGEAGRDAATAVRARLRAERDRTRSEARDLERAAGRARGEATRAGQAAVRAQEEAERAYQAAEDARRRARDLAAAARQAGSEADRAEREATRAARTAEQAEARFIEAQS